MPHFPIIVKPLFCHLFHRSRIFIIEHSFYPPFYHSHPIVKSKPIGCTSLIVFEIPEMSPIIHTNPITQHILIFFRSIFRTDFDKTSGKIGRNLRRRRLHDHNILDLGTRNDIERKSPRIRLRTRNSTIIDPYIIVSLG